jgi:hypothetical protein
MAKPHATTLIPGPTHEFLLIETRQAILPSHCALHNRPRLFFVYNLNSNIYFWGEGGGLFFQFKRLVSFSINKTIRLEADRSISFLFVRWADPDCKTFSRLVYFVSVSRHLLISFMGAWTACKDFWVSWPSIVWPAGETVDPGWTVHAISNELILYSSRVLSVDLCTDVATKIRR